MESVTYNKQQLRAHYLDRRAHLGFDYREQASQKICDFLQDLVRDKSKISGYYPIRNEVNILPLLMKLNSNDNNQQISLPSQSADGTFELRVWSNNQALRKNFFFNILEPEPGISQLMEPDVILIPLIAFDSKMNRLGYGYGCYDKILKNHPLALKVGCAFAIQAADYIPIEDHDIALDMVVTEQGVISK